MSGIVLSKAQTDKYSNSQCERQKVEVARLYLTLCDPMDYSLPASSVHGILQARILEWVAIPFSRGSSWPKDRFPALQADSLPAEPQGKPLDELNVKSLSHVQLSVTPWTVAYQAPLPMGLSKQLYWSGLPFPSPGKHFSIFVSIHTSCIMLETWIFWSFFCSIFTELFLMSENSFWINMRRKAEHPFSICLSFYGMWKSFKIHV